MVEAVATPPVEVAAPADSVPAPESTPIAVEAAPVAEVVAEPAVVEAPAAETPGLHTETPSLLEEATKEAAPGEVAPVEKPAEIAPPAAVAYESFKFPDGVVAEPEKIQAYTDIIGKIGVPQEAAQALVDLHTQAIQQFAQHTATEQHRVFGDTRKGWREEIKSDERMGGSSFQTTAAAVARMRDMFVPEADRAQFNDFLRVTGAGDHPAFWRLLHNASRQFDEPGLPSPNPKPPPGNGKPPKGAGRRVLYDHPSSARAS